MGDDGRLSLDVQQFDLVDHLLLPLTLKEKMLDSDSAEENACFYCPAKIIMIIIIKKAAFMFVLGMLSGWDNSVILCNINFSCGFAPPPASHSWLPLRLSSFLKPVEPVEEIRGGWNQDGSVRKRKQKGREAMETGGGSSHTQIIHEQKCLT